ncbi:MAG: hypothetical protein EBU90_21580, partial [Proteobacteria bacterium]|nr:hypothetical protein [Pseudomonadota bacterium]
MKIKILDNLNSFNDRIKYCDKNFIFLGTGTHRKVYKLDENSVIKVCFNEGGINQCKFEQQLPESPILIKTLYYSNNYN